ncbi:hypothetical protein PAXRUDRAFT_824431 [Paxillus rubicundulus Ve08.2h10]|uniref:Uncharacterized protein n=1 Tax=Paxillus rubicundulus Ve08.2h10 TaxID=930991 RepID=A0A0D0E208_9AGAM|nr:hypothetical protein PAXRUDRAFT_824431 [Paxillus rubicundulus Ve08.2h10]
MGQGDKPFGSGKTVRIGDLSPGNIIWVGATVHVNNLVNKKSKSSTAVAANKKRTLLYCAPEGRYIRRRYLSYHGQ